MHIRALPLVAAAMSALLLLPCSRVAAQTPVNSYLAVELGQLAYDLNDLGDYAGETPSVDGYQAYAMLGGVKYDLGTLGGAYSIALALNNNRHVVGYAYLPGDEESHAFVSLNGGPMQDLGHLGGGVSAAYDVNDAGQVVGISNDLAGISRAVLWQNGQIFDLGVPSDCLYSQANAINASGSIAVTGQDSNGNPRAYVWIPTVPNGTTGDFVAVGASFDTNAFGINSQGDVVGYGGFGPALWNSGGFTPLPPLAGAGSGIASAINDSRVIIGWNTGQDGNRAFVWDAANSTRDLSVLAGNPGQRRLDGVSAINGSGQILASYYGVTTYLLTPSPAPSKPLNLRDAGTGGLRLTWNASVGAASYRVKRWNGTAYTLAATVSTTSYNNAAIPNSQAGLYVVSGINAHGESPDSQPAVSLPVPPTGLTAAPGKGKGSIALKWTHSTSAGIVQYRIYRSTTSGTGYSLRSTVGRVTAFEDTGLASKTSYYYVVTAVNGSGEESIKSNQATAKTR